MPSSLQLAADDPALLDAVRRARKLLNRRALAGAAASTVPIPGLDWLVDAALLSKLIPAISEQFGLAPHQIDRLPKRKQDDIEKAIGVVGSIVIGKFITRDLVIRMAATIGRRLTVKQATKYVPLAGQALSALIGYTAIRYLGEQHIRDCVEVCKAAKLQLPAPAPIVLEHQAPADTD
ncbi:MAG: hypothetical protein K0R89_259 [Ramlibacter sp.]|jgi:hypothetical protein|nr:hypothetical protein [Ramlibacter sp.]